MTSTTLNSGSGHSTTLDLLSPGEDTSSLRLMSSLVIGWSLHESERVGERTLLMPKVRYSVGRGPESAPSGLVRALWASQRPGQTVSHGLPLGGKSLSRHHLEVSSHPNGVAFRVTGRTPVYLNGHEVSEGLLTPEDTLQIAQELLLICEQRPDLPYPPLGSVPPFAQPDLVGLIGESAPIWQLRDRLQLILATQQPLLIRGENGTGKKLLCHLVHKASVWVSHPFVYLQSATLTEAQLTQLSERTDRPFVLLDTIEDLPESLVQPLARLLRLHSLPVPPFWICATTQGTELADELTACFLSYVKMPSIQEIRSDIPLLARQFLRHMTQDQPQLLQRFFQLDSPLPTPRLSLALSAVLLRHRYHENLRELYSLLWTSLSTSLPPSLDLTPELTQRLQTKVNYTNASNISEEQVRAALKASQNRVAAAAQLLGLKNRWTLYRLLDKYDIRY